MKKKCAAVLLPLMLLLAACAPRVSPAVDVSALYFYLPVTVDQPNGSTQVLHRFNLTTGRLTPLCPDPVCAHDDACPFAGLRNYAVDGSTIWFDRHMSTS